MCRGGLGRGDYIPYLFYFKLNIWVFGSSTNILIAYFTQGFNSKQLSDGEVKCISQCSEKYLKLTQRVGFRFAEQQTLKEQAALNNKKP